MTTESLPAVPDKPFTNIAALVAIGILGAIGFIFAILSTH
jgi:preprotein translocase subunit Sss1